MSDELLTSYSCGCDDVVYVTLLFYVGNYNGAGQYNGDGWDGGRGYSGRGRGRARGRAFRGRGRGYGSQPGGYNDYGESGAPPAQGRGKFLKH